MKFRKKPVEIEAWPARELHSYARHGWRNMPPAIEEAYDRGEVIFIGDGRVSINTLEGVIYADPGDWIIRGIKGELYPCKPDIFEATYDKVE